MTTSKSRKRLGSFVILSDDDDPPPTKKQTQATGANEASNSTKLQTQPRKSQPQPTIERFPTERSISAGTGGFSGSTKPQVQSPKSSQKSQPQPPVARFPPERNLSTSTSSSRVMEKHKPAPPPTQHISTKSQLTQSRALVEEPRKVLDDLSSNVRAPEPQVPQDGQKLVAASPLVIIPAGYFLTFYELTEKYSTWRQETRYGGKSFDLWLDRIGMCQYPFIGSCGQNSQSERDAVENTWADEPAEKRRVVERLAIYTKYSTFISLHSIPLREHPSRLNEVPPMPFYYIERQYFSFRPFDGFSDLIAQRDKWLYDVGFSEARPYPLPQSIEQTTYLDSLYGMKYVLERKEIESRARYLKMLVTLPNPSWTEFEKQYEIYPANCFTTFASWSNNRIGWLKQLGLDCWPFNFTNITETFNILADVAWSEKPPEERATIVAKAKDLRDNSNEMFTNWYKVEGIFGFSTDMYADDPSEAEELDSKRQYEMMRLSWLRNINMSNSLAPEETLKTRWDKMGMPAKVEVLKKAKAEREKWCSDYAVAIVNGDGSKPREWWSLPLCLQEEAMAKKQK
ncbi:hypothetical protein G7Y89_g10583 [Cudoniella acicularis]|uniref:Uncharacterized protein n=1 Tax=Cudoniella acicularis TaxID=354080 RepID=A0A8H4RE13_9HELO|nr:hypothetical protein G7Y89_g10583 [Cudoniella acicularis]